MPGRSDPSMRTEPPTASSCVAPRKTRHGRRRTRTRATPLDASIPRNKRSGRHHDNDAREAHQDVGEQAVRHLGEHEMSGKGQKYAQAEGLERMLTADDGRPDKRRLER